MRMPMLRSVDQLSIIACMSESRSMCWYQITSMVENTMISSLRVYSSPRFVASRRGCRYIC